MQNDKKSSTNLLSIGKASEYLGISVDTLRRWAKKGRVEPLRSPGSHRYFRKEDLDKLFDKRYTRDEPTIRKSSSKISNNQVSDNTLNTDTPLVNNTQDLVETNYTATDDDKVSIETQTKSQVQTGLPAWRAVEITEETSYQIESQTENGQSSVEEKIEVKEEMVEKPTRPIEIPKMEPLRIAPAQTENHPQPQETKPDQNYQNPNFSNRNNSILTPPQKLPKQNPLQASVKSENKVSQNFQSKLPSIKYIYIFLTSIVVLVIMVIIYLIFRPTYQPLSPIPTN